MNVESYFIKLFSAHTRHIGDDGAVIGKQIYSNDAFCEDVHFRRSWMTLKQIAYKSMLVNISDAVAMNAKAQYALLSVAIPSSYSLHDLKELHSGFQEAAEKYGVEIIGGDTVSNRKLDISITIISHSERPLRRDGLKKGDLLAYTGSLGKSARDLRYLLNGGKVHSGSKFVNFSLRSAFIADATKSLSCGMDISDGLGSDLERLYSLNRVGFHFNKRLDKKLFCSGEEYEMLVGFNPRQRKKLIRLAAKNRTPLQIFAKADRTAYRRPCKAHHF
ncbi:MAG: thiamine-phosphate kinase [Helicobacteraceae bacterium]|nr:thiamine-phosphate kinase [Helicobacteraceae bacterium]